MNWKPYTASAIAFGLALACIAGAGQQYAASLVPGAVVPFAIGGVPGSVVGLLLVAAVGLGVGLWLLPRSASVPSPAWPHETIGDAIASQRQCQILCGQIAQMLARDGNREGLKLVTELAVYIASGVSVAASKTPVKGGGS